MISASGDVDWHRFDLDGFGMVEILATSYPLLGTIEVVLVVTIGPGSTRMTALIAPGTYRFRVSGGINLYELTATITPFALLADEFEPNDSFDGATRFTVRSIPKGGDVTLGPIAGTFDVPAGTFDLTIHNPNNPDFFGIRTGADRGSTRPILRIGKTDAPMGVTLYDASRNEISRHDGVRHLELELPVSTVTFVKISAQTVTRYLFTTGQEYDKRRVSEAYQEELVFSVPVPGDRPNWRGDEINYLAFEVDERAMEPQNFPASCGRGCGIDRRHTRRKPRSSVPCGPRPAVASRGAEHRHTRIGSRNLCGEALCAQPNPRRTAGVRDRKRAAVLEVQMAVKVSAQPRLARHSSA